ncbi:Shedu immune nuclease family protein [Pseudocolwellia agarivorans]|uniref:Shedu immune nuclease family protein n=1 Tax=Pseudocolwellia agarivorans TaxID=1911682 RepID=UPI0009858EEC|nr:Shedu immune nuclease family protein [Pseudocolwellia agarivorans]
MYDLKPSEEDVIRNSRLETLYNHKFDKGRFFQVVFEDENEVHVKIAPRTMMKVVYIKDNDDIEGIKLCKVVSGEEKQSIEFTKFNLEQLKTFLLFIQELDLKGIAERRIKLADDSLDILDSETKKKITTLLSGSDGGDLVRGLLSDGMITTQDLVNTGYRKSQLNIFNNLLNHNYLPQYKIDIGKINTKDETAWQHFFAVNQWIFGYGLDYRFQGILQKEFHASDTNAGGSEGVIADYLMGDNNFTTFVELKLPSTPLFGTAQNRAQSWKLSKELMEGYSQILEQKASGSFKVQSTKNLYADDYSKITQHAFDSKAILIIGNWGQINDCQEGIQEMKRKSLELFRRDSRNIEILTYDELYERALFIVGH